MYSDCHQVDPAGCGDMQCLQFTTSSQEYADIASIGSFSVDDCIVDDSDYFIEIHGADDSFSEITTSASRKTQGLSVRTTTNMRMLRIAILRNSTENDTKLIEGECRSEHESENSADESIIPEDGSDEQIKHSGEIAQLNPAGSGGPEER
ncbi:unnamed protein product [Phytophthora fragariaefolia]|uniref:Unnamed protein product n=1 Tax=Phytophthora fragariaefolia TaxID=1490495 RepID=A0A9W6YCB9_9STRA|nr:unnamed protein product [Phytophthora fragariaefolia]